MDVDLVFVIGLGLGVLSIPAFISAWADRRSPQPAALTAIIAVVIIGVAYYYKPGGYTIEGIPDVIYGVIGQAFFGNG